MAPHPINDPLVSAAKGCHAEVVQLLADKHVLCAACAAAEAARKGCSKITMDLAMGHGKAMMQVRLCACMCAGVCGVACMFLQMGGRAVECVLCCVCRCGGHGPRQGHDADAVVCVRVCGWTSVCAGACGHAWIECVCVVRAAELAWDTARP